MDSIGNDAVPGVVSSLVLKPADVKKGTEKFHINGVDYRDESGTATLLDFWRWGYSRLIADVTRGVLAEFIVARLIGADLRVPASPDREFDFKTTTGARIEVKSSAYVQDWQTRKRRTDSDTSFSGLKCRLFQSDSALPTYAAAAEYHAEIFVFCVLKTRDEGELDPLNLDEWDFYVLTRRELEQMLPPNGPGRISLKILREHDKESLKARDLASRIAVAEDAIHSRN